MIIDTRRLYPDTHITNYNYLILNQYHLKIEGLWVVNYEYYILCPEINDFTLAIDGTNLKEWYRDHSILGAKTNLVNKLPVGAKRVETPDIERIANFAGAPRNYTFFLNDLLASLPRDFPEFRIQDNNTGTINFVTVNPLSADEESILKNAIHKMGIATKIETINSNNLSEIKQYLLDDVMILQHSKMFKGLTGTKTIKIWESDEDFWNEKRERILRSSTKKAEFYPDKFEVNRSSCIISDSITPLNIRTFLTLYNTIYLNPPLLENSESYWQHLGVTEQELVALVDMNKVKFLLTQPLHRYKPRLLEILAEQSTDKYLSPRRLSAITIADLRNRNPLLFPTFSDEVKYELLHQLHHNDILSKHLPNGLDRKLLSSFSSIWGNYLEDVHRLGVSGLRNYSSYYFLDAIFMSMGKDYGVELLDSIPSVDFGAALQSNVIPKYWNGYSDEKMVTIIANLYSGIPNNIIPKNLPYSNTSVDRILVINKDVPVLDLAQTFTHNDIDRFRNLVFNLTEHKKNEQELDSSLKLFNEHVINYERSKKRLDALDISGFLIDSTSFLSNVNVPLGSWIFDRANDFLDHIGVKSGTIQQILDELSSFKTGGTLPNAILVARMRNQLKEKWFQRQFRKIGF